MPRILDEPAFSQADEGAQHWDSEALTHGISVPSSRVGPQQLLFGSNPQQVCAEVRLSWSRALDLYRDGFLSFSPALVERLDEAQEMELRFVGALARTGCERQVLAQLLRGLSYPYTYDLSRIYYDWQQCQWRPMPSPDPEASLTGWLEKLVTSNDASTLEGIVQLAKEALHHVNPKA